MSRAAERETRRNDAFTAVFDANWARVRHHVEGAVEHDTEVTEIVSEVFLLAWTRLNPAKPMDGIWLLRAADRVLRGRSGRTIVRRRALETVHRGFAADDRDPDLTQRARALSALAALSGRERRIIMLTYWDGLGVGEIAQMLRMPRSRVRRILGRARDRMHSELEREKRAGDDD
jgi:RNA polymerase sigma factor (sigma-70 family)